MLIEQKFAKIVEEIKPIESGYSARIYDCSREIQKIHGPNAAWTVISMATLGLETMPRR
jgi:hypothetical protein